MPGSGKSTVGVILAKLTSRHFVDTDLLIQASGGRTLQGIVDSQGVGALRAIEENVLRGLACADHVIATGGSAVYSPKAMEHLRSAGLVVFLDVDLPALASRIRNYESRGIARRPDQTLADLYAERRPLYMKYADFVIECRGLDQEQVCAKIIEQVPPPAAP